MRIMAQKKLTLLLIEGFLCIVVNRKPLIKNIDKNIIIETRSGKSFGYDNYHGLKNYIYESFKSFLEGKSKKRKPIPAYMSRNIAKRIEKIIITL